MGFWIFSFISATLIPLIMLIFGLISLKNIPKEINNFVGYRTSLSMKNKETWAFAHKHSGRIWRRVGGITYIVSVIVMLFMINKSVDAIGIATLILCVLQTIIILISIIPTQQALKKNFDKNGKYININKKEKL